MIIRPERPEDHGGIRAINMKAFETEAEANLVGALRKSGVPLISLVAEEKGTLDKGRTGVLLPRRICRCGRAGPSGLVSALWFRAIDHVQYQVRI